MSARYKVVDESVSGHCCFECTVVDTQADGGPSIICECFTREDADKVCAALNAYAPLPEPPVNLNIRPAVKP